MAAGKTYRDAAEYTDDPLQSHVTVLVVPHDLSWEEDELVSPQCPPGVRCRPDDNDVRTETKRFLDNCLQKIRQTDQGRVAFLVGGRAAIADEDAVVMIGKICAKLGAVLYCENAFARVDRGHGRPHMRRLPYFPQDAARELASYAVLVTMDCRLPVAPFGYQNGPSELVLLGEDDVWQIDAGSATVAVLRYLFTQIDAGSITPGVNCRGIFVMPLPQQPTLPQGRLTTGSLCAAVAALQPPHAIIVDESITSGGPYWELSKGCSSFTHLTLTGGAIGCGPALSIGAAIACPDRTVINLQADGSAMYAPQVCLTFWPLRIDDRCDCRLSGRRQRSSSILSLSSALTEATPYSNSKWPNKAFGS